MPNGKQISEHNITLFEAWVATQSDEDFSQIIMRGKLNRTEIAKAVGFGKSALNQNPQIKKRLEELENGLRKLRILPPLTEKAKKEIGKPKEYDSTRNKRRHESMRLSVLEQENIELKTRVKDLDSQLERYGELSESLYEIGIMPR